MIINTEVSFNKPSLITVVSLPCLWVTHPWIQPCTTKMTEKKNKTHQVIAYYTSNMTYSIHIILNCYSDVAFPNPSCSLCSLCPLTLSAWCHCHILCARSTTYLNGSSALNMYTSYTQMLGSKS